MDKTKILEDLLAKLFEPDKRRMDKEISRLNLLNQEIRGGVRHGFMHMGTRYIPPEYASIAPALARKLMPTLAFELQEDGRQFHLEIMRLNNDKAKIRQMLHGLTYQATSMKELRDAYPECVVPFIASFAGMPREIKDCTYLIRSDKYAMMAYEKMLPVLMTYTVAGLFF